MIDISTWINEFLHTLTLNFGERVWFVGLQGSYGRGEATETSDINVVVILDRVIVDTFLALKNGETIRFPEMSETLFAWAKNWNEK